MSWPHQLPLARSRLVGVIGDGALELRFDHPAAGVLTIEGPFTLGAPGAEPYQPPFADGIVAVVAGLTGAVVESARYRRTSALRVVFEGGVVLAVDDGPYQSWWYRDGTGLSLHGGVGTVA